MADSDLQLLINLGFIVIVAAVFAFAGKLIRMPTIVCYILAGIVLGPTFNLVELLNACHVLEVKVAAHQSGTTISRSCGHEQSKFETEGVDLVW